MKFAEGSKWRCRGDCCDWITVVKCIADTGQEAEIRAVWYTQLDSGYKQVSIETQFRINKRSYNLWRPYNPRGELVA